MVEKNVEQELAHRKHAGREVATTHTSVRPELGGTRAEWDHLCHPSWLRVGMLPLQDAWEFPSAWEFQGGASMMIRCCAFSERSIGQARAPFFFFDAPQAEARG